MNRRMTIALAAVLVSQAAAAAETREFDLPTFDEVYVSSGIKAEISVGGDQSVRIEAESRQDFRRLDVRVRNGKLMIDLERGFFESLRDWMSEGPNITAYVTAPAVTELGASSGARATAKGMKGRYLTLTASSGAHVTVSELDGEEVSSDASSGGSVDVAGTCTRLDAAASSGGHLDLARLACKEVHVDVSSGASASVFASESLDANASSGGHVRVTGGPHEVNTSTSAGGDVTIDR
jgi:hypothetical protein